MTTNKYYLGLDIGGSSVKYGYGDCQQGVQYHHKFELTEKSLAHLHHVCQQILAEVEAMVGLDNILAIGIGTCGTLDSESGKIVGVNPNLPYWVGHSPKELIPPELQIPVAWDNDANLMCLAEASLHPDNASVVGIPVGSGIGSGYVQNGQIYHGAHGYAMELGHITVCPEGELCNCGRKGCLEAYAGVEGMKCRIEAEYGTAYANEVFSSLSALIRSQKEHPEITRIIADGAQYLSLAVANLILLLDPDLVVFGGGAMDAGLYDLNDLQQQIHSLLPELNRAHTRLEKALAGNQAGVLGAIILASQLFGAK